MTYNVFGGTLNLAQSINLAHSHMQSQEPQRLPGPSVVGVIFTEQFLQNSILFLRD